MQASVLSGLSGPCPSPGGPTQSRGANRFYQKPGIFRSSKMRAASASPMRLSTTSHVPLEKLVFSAMRHLPAPILVLNSSKTVVFANEAIGALLGIKRRARDDHFEDFSDVQTRLRGQALCQVGVDMLQDGLLTWVSWDAFLDSVAMEPRDTWGKKKNDHGGSHPTTNFDNVPGTPSPTLASSPIQDIAVDVVIRETGPERLSDIPTPGTCAHDHQIHATMIVTAWEFADQQTYFTLTFTARSAAAPTPPDAASGMDPQETSGPERARAREGHRRSISLDDDLVMLSSTQFPPPRPPTRPSRRGPLSHLQKLTMMKDAVLNTTDAPIFAMWKDGSASFPNRAARSMFSEDSRLKNTPRGLAGVSHWDVYNEDFSRKLDTEETPICTLLRTEKPFSGVRFGLYVGPERRPRVFEARGELIRDSSTGEVVAGLVIMSDITRFTDEISEIKEYGEARFQQICDTMPQLVWTTDGIGGFDFFNSRWLEYTGLRLDMSTGDSWTSVVHPDDRAAVRDRWIYCTETGEPYSVEYRIQNTGGDYRWFLGRANPLRRRDTGEIYKWFGTCTDIHEAMEASLAAQRMQQQLSTVITHSQVTLFTVDIDRRLLMFEGALALDAKWKQPFNSEDQVRPEWFIGENVYEVFARMGHDIPARERLDFLQPIEDVFSGKEAKGVREHTIHDRWYRTQFIPMWAKSSLEGTATYIEGVIGVIMDVTELKQQEAALEEEGIEKRQAIANETAAREANRLKSQFLANMSHEIRTPISGVLGMAELLAASAVDREQREYLGNIQRSAGALLTVVNDILDFSKVESGQLEVEEVEFSLSSMISGVQSMLNFIASRKELEVHYDVPHDMDNSFMVIGDPGRVRQIIMNLITNSIKFTDKGYVRFTIAKEGGAETDPSVTVRFTVEDSGIGMTDEVKAKLFQPFAQGDPSTARKFGGTGLGLTICKNLLDLMNGRIAIDSSPGKGTTTTFWIPFRKALDQEVGSIAPTIDTLSDRLQWEMSLLCNTSEYTDVFMSPTKLVNGEKIKEPPPVVKVPVVEKQPTIMMPSVSEQDLPMSERSGVHVLIVEDNAVNQRITTKFVTMLGFQMAAVWNGKEALDYIRDAQEGKNTKPNIILMDCQMPVVDGYKCTHALRHHAPFKEYAKDILIIAMTASAIQGDREKCTRAGMDDYLSKPVRSKTLEKMLIKWCLTRRPLPEDPTEDPEISASDCPESLEHVESDAISGLDLSNLEDGGLSSPTSETTLGPHTPGYARDGSFGEVSWDGPTRRPSEDVSGPWSRMPEEGDVLEIKSVERAPDRRGMSGVPEL
ncbi:related to histidine kinase [Cephalotrichum gorgonifer]|uniref:histidine kinase n=1 Tax=Cephalotrichum gorgonifer TaxID=2041049 RepID=A0AAE8N994_9PEZI|nr:related to histidine kinase [Cephalotrichum gorgonifer]